MSSERESALREAIDEIRTEARWQEEQRRRDQGVTPHPWATRSYFIDRLLMLETILRDRLPGNPDKDGAAVGDRVRVTLEGELVAFDADLGHWTLRGCSVPDRHVTWDYTLHWGTTFTPISSPISDSGGTQ